MCFCITDRLKLNLHKILIHHNIIPSKKIKIADQLGFRSEEGAMKKAILKTARLLKQPGKASMQDFKIKWENLSAKGTRMLMARPDIEKLIGKGNESMAEDNNRNFPRFMAALFLDYEPEVFVDTVLWVFRAYRSHGFQTTYWAANLNLWVDLLEKDLTPEAFEDIYPFYNWLIVNIPVFVALTDLDLLDHDPLRSPVNPK